MSIFRVIKCRFEDIWEKICNNLLKVLLCVFVAVAGVVIGCVFFNVFRYDWWYLNRVNYADKLFFGGFALFISFAISALLYYLCTVASNLAPWTRSLSVIALFIACLYCGANTAAAIECWSFWGVMFAILVTLVEVIGYTLCCAISLCEVATCRTFSEAMCDLKLCSYVLLVSLLLKNLGFFVILKILTAII